MVDVGVGSAAGRRRWHTLKVGSRQWRSSLLREKASDQAQRKHTDEDNANRTQHTLVVRHFRLFVPASELGEAHRARPDQ
jgi:hypothetical protein